MDVLPALLRCTLTTPLLLCSALLLSMTPLLPHRATAACMEAEQRAFRSPLSAALDRLQPDVGARTQVVAAPVGAHAAEVAAAATTGAPTAAPPSPVWGRARMLHPKSHCHVPPFAPGGPGIPYFEVGGLPRVDEFFLVQWSTKPTVPSSPPAWPAALLVSPVLLDTPLDAFGAPGCHLQLRPDMLLLPGSNVMLQSGGLTFFGWVPPASQLGLHFYAQLLVAAPGVNAAGLVVSPALQIEIGNQ